MAETSKKKFAGKWHSSQIELKGRTRTGDRAHVGLPAFRLTREGEVFRGTVAQVVV
jgi:hypothetical protein